MADNSESAWTFPYVFNEKADWQGRYYPDTEDGLVRWGPFGAFTGEKVGTDEDGNYILDVG